MAQEHKAEVALRTLLLTDLVGSTKLVETLGDVAAADAFRQHDDLARTLLEKHRGREIDKTDGFLMLFERPIDAVRYALAFHRELTELGKKLDIDLRVRCGIHLGEVILRENSPEAVAKGAKPLDVEGLAKPQAARAMALAMGRQTLVTRTAYDIARRSWVGEDAGGHEVSWQTHGNYEFKGVAEAVEISEVGEKGLAPLVPPLDGEKAKRVLAKGEVAIWRPGLGLEVPDRRGWELERQLGVGGFGDVWLAKRGATRRVFKFSFDEEARDALAREVDLIQHIRDTLGHRPDIAQVVDWQLEQVPYYLELNFEPGGSLLDWAQAQGGLASIPMETRVALAAQIADALAAAHDADIVHKDVKPQNILIRQDPAGNPHVVLTDFGVGEELSSSTSHGKSTSGHSMATAGTRMYMAPEVMEGERATALADIYALGVLLYQFARGNFAKALSTGWERHVKDEMLREEISSCVQGDPEDRIASASEIAERLRSLDERRRSQPATAPAPAPAATPPPTTSTPAAPAEQTSAPASKAEEGGAPATACAACGSEIVDSYLLCERCGNSDHFCSEDCFDAHQKTGHCSECMTRLGEQYKFSDKINAAIGERRFCSDACLARHTNRVLCGACEQTLPQQYFVSDKVDAARGHETRFCSDACVQAFVKERLCSECAQQLPQSHFTCAICGPDRRLCTDACVATHQAKHRA